ncbi:hypothetical protein SteCoe_33723 [Stentor coeruleus]|uniref:Uncharacterized protein n=1 Tax=Stentor coeruleus TaxID=5963 RepID=A0A1R2AW10_9CILI|nr:hypothetical protein SteCoe_33723 [Stentor coeruleus]
MPKKHEDHFAKDDLCKSPVIKYLLDDTSLSKSVKVTDKTSKLDFTLEKAHQRLRRQVKRKTMATLNLEIFRKWEEIIEESIKNHNIELTKIDNAAITIQRMMKGCMTRAKYMPFLLSDKEFKAKDNILGLKDQTDKCMLTLGLYTVRAAIKVQRAYRRYLVIKKLRVMMTCYNRHLKIKRNLAKDYIRKGLRFFGFRLKRNFLVFIRFRERKLEDIKRALAVLTIKKIWVKKNLNMKILKQRIARAKRMRIAKQNKEAFEKYFASLGGSLSINRKEQPKKQTIKENKETSQEQSDKLEFTQEKPDKSADSLPKISNINTQSLENFVKEQAEKDLQNEENNEDVQKNEETVEKDENKERDEEERIFKEAERIRSMIERRIKYLIEKGKLAYGIKDFLPKAHLPIMHDKVLESLTLTLEEIENKARLLCPTTSTLAKTRYFKREKSPKCRSFQINSPKSTEKYIHVPTSSALSITYPYPSPQSTKFQDFKTPDSNNFLVYTESYYNKVKDIVSVKEKKDMIFNAKYRKNRKNFKIKMNNVIKERKLSEGNDPRQKKKWVSIVRENIKNEEQNVEEVLDDLNLKDCERNGSSVIKKSIGGINYSNRAQTALSAMSGVTMPELASDYDGKNANSNILSCNEINSEVFNIID